ncbi:MAG TPA: adenylosuccinate synthetase [Thermoanaerobaculia bacterium]|jgi:adenylosuccinate synthase
MPKQIIILSGPVACGKTTLGDALETRFGFRRLKTRQLIRAMLGTEPERTALQKAGEDLDRETNGQWVATALTRQLVESERTLAPGMEAPSVIVDSARLISQVEAIRDAFGRKVVHVHLTAPVERLAERYAARTGAIHELASYDQVRADPTEAQVETLAGVADIVIDTVQSAPEDVFVRVAARLGLYGRSVERLVDVLVGGQYGSEGKGHIADHVAPEYDVLIRVGGPNAGHTVFEVPKPYTFHLLPSGTRRNSRARIVLGPGAVVALPRLLQEINQCEVAPERLAIDPQAILIDAKDIEVETTLRHSIGSTGQGVGNATSRKVLRTLAHPPVRLAREAPELMKYIVPTRAVLEAAYAAGHRILLEGTQGTGLSLHHGSYPWVTSRDTTVSGTIAEAGIAPTRVRKVVMVVRTYPIRVESPSVETAGEVGSGPMSREIEWAEIARRSGVSLEELQAKERTSTTGRKRRVAEFDWELLRKAATLNAPTDIALTFADYLRIENRAARRYEQLTDDTLRFIEEVERVATAPVSLIAVQFAFRSIIDRRAW